MSILLKSKWASSAIVADQEAQALRGRLAQAEADMAAQLELTTGTAGVAMFQANPALVGGGGVGSTSANESGLSDVAVAAGDEEEPEVFVSGEGGHRIDSISLQVGCAGDTKHCMSVSDPTRIRVAASDAGR